MGRKRKKDSPHTIFNIPVYVDRDKKFAKLFAEYRRLGYPETVAYEIAFKEASDWAFKQRLVNDAKMTVKMLILTKKIPDNLEKKFMSLARWYIKKICANEIYPIYDVMEEGIEKFKLNGTPYEEHARFLLKSLYDRSQYR